MMPGYETTATEAPWVPKRNTTSSDSDTDTDTDSIAASLETEIYTDTEMDTDIDTEKKIDIETKIELQYGDWIHAYRAMVKDPAIKTIEVAKEDGTRWILEKGWIQEKGEPHLMLRQYYKGKLIHTDPFWRPNM